MKYSLFIGRWQPWHAGHRWLIDERLNEGKNVCIAIRETEINDSNPFSTDEIIQNLSIELKDLIESGRVKVISLPDIESINFGRGVGYEIIEHVPPSDIGKISATEIRKKMKEEK
mgnify:CR=1 FL=1|tara:strand:+ start:559 stop:903 length:345 start_codon:yes stop_codon:yes gene_type:complete